MSLLGGLMVLVASMLVGISPTAGDPSLVGQWEIGEATVRWVPDERIPLTAAQIVVELDGEPLPTVVSADGREVRAELPPVTGSRPVERRDLAVVAAGRRLDAPPVRPLRRALPSATDHDWPLAGVDPLQPGSFDTRRGEYDLPPISIDNFVQPVEFRAVVIGPVSDGTAKPLVVFLHGRHVTCSGLLGDIIDFRNDWPCRGNLSSVPSYRGYEETQELLASRGYVTVSISANGINGQDVRADGGAAGRADLVSAHLAAWSRWSAGDADAPAIVREVAPADMAQVMLVGHSRGGEGINRAALDAQTPGTPWTIRGLVHLAPTAFAHNPVAGVPATVLLPACDGDLFDLQGQSYVDDGRRSGRDSVLRTSILIGGANHNFFNTEWTPGLSVGPSRDDADFLSETCQSATASDRLSPGDQRRVASLYVSAATDSAIRRDGQATALLDGSAVRPRGVDVPISVHAVGGRRVPALLPTPSTAVTTSGPMAARTCTARRIEDLLTPEVCGRPFRLSPSPHLNVPAPPLTGLASRAGVDLLWSGDNSVASFALGQPGERVNLSSSEELHLRVIGPEVRFAVRLVDRDGNAQTLPATTMPRALNGGEWVAGVAREVRFDLPSQGIDLSDVSQLQILPESTSGGMAILDAWGWRSGLSEATPLQASRVDATVQRVTEGSVPRQSEVLLSVSPANTEPASIRVRLGGASGSARFEDVAIPAGATQVAIPIEIDGDRRDDADLTYSVALQSTDTAVAGEWLGRFTVVDDDDPPTVTIEPVAASVIEGEPMQWRIAMDGTSDVAYDFFVGARVPLTGTEITVEDLDPIWVLEETVPVPPATAFSQLSFSRLSARLEPGQLSAVISVPTRRDEMSEPPELGELAFRSPLLGSERPGGAIAVIDAPG